MARTLPLFPLLLTLPALAHAGSSADPLAALAQQRAQQAIAQASSPRGAAALYRLHELQDQLQELGPIIKVDQRIAANPKADPFTRTTAKLLELATQQALGHDPRVNELSSELGFIRDFEVLGAFDNEGKAGCDTDAGPEAKLDLTQTFPVKGHSVGWHPLTERPRDGYVDLGAALRPNQQAVGYALTFLKAERPRTTTLALGTTGAYRLWVNGRLAGKSDRYNTAAPDQARVSVHLRPGYNRVLLKVCQDQGPFGFYLRQDVAPNQFAAVVLPQTLPPQPAVSKSEAPKPLPTLSDAIAALAKAHPQDAQLLADQAEVLAHTHAFDQKEHTDKVLAARAAQLAPRDLAIQMLAGELEQQDRNLRRAFFEAALKAAPDDPRPNVALGQQELSQDRPARARELAEKAVELAPRYAPARMLLATTLEALGDWPGAVAQTEATLKLFPRVPAVVRSAAAISRRLDRPTEGLERLRVANALRDDVGTAQSLSSLLADLGDVDEATRVLQRALNGHPFENGLRVRLAELLCANGKLDPGLAQFAAAKKLAPDEPEILSREGQALLEAGRKDQAMASFEKALALRPQNPAMQEVVRALKGESDTFGEKYAFDVSALVKEADSYAGEDAVTLADYTYVRVQRSGLSARFHQLALKVYSDRGVNAFRSYPITFSPDRQQVKVLRARITKPDGSVVESYGDTDRNMNEPWTGMYYDIRAKLLSFPALAKGDVLELEYRIEDTAQENLLSDYWGDVDYVQGITPTLRYLYIADLPKGRPLYWNQDSLGKGVIASQEPGQDGRTLYAWRAKDVSKIDPEPGMPGWSEIASTLHVSTYQTWDQVAQYWWGLVRDQLTPNDELKNTVDRVLAHVDRKDTRAVVQAIYDFVVTNTRYVALEFGIHGYKPYRVDQVLARRFGDCKDKASLITAMLKVAGVDTDLVLLRMRNLGQIGGSPASLAPFNHAIAYVPGLDLYLDGTAEFHGSSELPDVDHVADALIVDGSGHGKFLVTPETKADRNETTLSMEVMLRTDGSAEVKGASDVSGENAPSYRRSYQAAATRKAQFEQGWAQTFPGLKVQSVEMSDSGLLEKGVHLRYAMSVPRYAEVKKEGLRFFPFGSGRSYTQTYAPLAERKFDLILSGPWTNAFSFRYAIPKGMAVADLPSDVQETTPFGHYQLQQREENGTLVAEGKVVVTVDRVSAKDYPKFRAFLARLDQAFQRRVELTRMPTQASAAPAGTATSAAAPAAK